MEILDTGESIMSDAIFVLNAGSSSLKYSIYGLKGQDLNVVAHGEIEGLGASAHFKAKDQRGRTLADVSLGDSTRSFGHAEAFAHLAHWAYEHFADELVPLAVGHRVVHGGLTFSEPTLIDAAVMTETGAAHSAGAAAPTAQSEGHQSGDAVVAGPAAGRLFRYGIPPGKGPGD